MVQRIFIFLCLLLVTLPHSLIAADESPRQKHSVYSDFKLEYLSVNDGLSSNNTAAIIQDKQGFLWVGTIDGGLNKYDGTEFINYVNQPDKKDSLSSNYVWRLHLDEQGRIWTVSWGGGLSCYDPVKDSFVNYLHDENDEYSLSSNLIWSVLVDSLGRLWVGTDNGLDRYDFETNSFIHYRNDLQSASSLSHNSVSMIKEDHEGNLWLSTYGGGLNKFDPRTGLFTNYRSSLTSNSTHGQDFIWTMCQDSKGNFWLGSEGGLLKFDPKTEKFTDYLHADEEYNVGLITEIFEDSQNRIWVGTSGSGLKLIDPTTGQIKTFRHDQDNPYSLADDTIWGIYEDVTGVIWFATFNGVNRYDEHSFRFNHYQRYAGIKNSLSANPVQAFYQDQNNIIWIGTRGGGLNRFDPDKQQFTHFLHDLNDPNSLSNNTVLDIAPAGDNALWIGTSSGIDLFDVQKETFTNLQHDPSDQSTLGHGTVWGIALSNKKLWVGLYGGGLDCIDLETGKITHFTPDEKNSNSILTQWVTTVYIDTSGMIWVGTEGGVSLLDPATGLFKNFEHDTSDSSSISDPTVHTIFQDSQQRIWIGTNKGFNLYDKETGNFTRYGVEDGLAGNTTASITEDNQGNLWLGTNQGLSRFNPETKTFRNYDAKDGLQGNQFLRKAALRTKTGQLYFGGVNGFNTLNPEKLENNKHVPPVKLTQFLISNKPVQVGTDSPLKEHINVANNILLSHDQSTFSFKFAVLNYLSSGKNQYAYKMEGFDKNWIYVDNTSPFARYTNLDPGEYVFRVKGSNNDGVWNNDGASISLTITPPWWQTLWFITLITAMFLGAILCVHKLRLRAINNKKTELEKLVSERTTQLEENRIVLQKAKDELEHKVEERTADLIKANEEIQHEILQKKQEANRYKNTIETSIDGFWMLDNKHQFLEINQAYCDMLGYQRDELLKMTLADIDAMMSEEEIQNVSANVIRSGSIRFESQHRHKNGSLIDVEVSVTYSNEEQGLFFVFLRDLTYSKIVEKEKETLEKKLHQAQKMEAVGTLAGGIAHDFNNILAPIMAYTEILIDEVGPDIALRKKLEEVLKGTFRARDLVKQILAFSRQESSDSRQMQIQPIVKEALKLIRSSIPVTIEIKQDIQKDCGFIKANPTHIHQIIMNLATNAYHAMETDGGELKITLKEVDFSEHDVIIQDMVPGPYACLFVSDTGVGMDDELKSQIFDPFFTTKEQGKGTGMGLSVVHGIVKSMGGHIQVYSELNKGTIFKLYFPVQKTSQEQVIPKTSTNVQGGTERILLVDDDESIIKVGQKFMERLGYQVTSITSSIDALNLFGSNPDQFDLVVTDMTMPKMTGDRLSFELRKIRPDIPVIICTGFSDIMSEEDASALGINGFLMKPFMMKDLAEKIREVLFEDSQQK